MIRLEEARDHWYTPVEILEGLIKASPHRTFFDVMTSPGTPDVEGLIKFETVDIYDRGDMKYVTDVMDQENCPTLFENTPFSKLSGGAAKHIRRLCEVFPEYQKVFLVNYDAWAPRLAEELGMHIALIYPRVSFIPGHPDLKAGSPRYANAFICDPYIVPLDLGRYSTLSTEPA